MGYADELFDLTDRVVLVTGGSRGLGREMAFAAAQCGADVVIASRKLDSCEATAEEIASATGRAAMPYQVHVGRWDELDGLVDAAYERFGKVDVLINNAGMSPLYESLDSVSEKLFDAVINFNLKGPFRLSTLVGRAHGGRRRWIDHQRQLERVAASPAGTAALLGGEGGAQRVDGGACPGLRPDRARQHVDARSVSHRHQQGVGHTRRRRRVRRASRSSGSATRPRSSAPLCIWRRMRRVTPADRSSGSTAGFPSRYGSTMLKPGSGRSTTAMIDGSAFASPVTSRPGESASPAANVKSRILFASLMVACAVACSAGTLR